MVQEFKSSSINGKPSNGKYEGGQMVNGKWVNGKLPQGIYIHNGRKEAVR